MKWHVGTSGWGYDNWNEEFYPAGVTGSNRLAYYARHFDAVEINSSFYHLPPAAQFKKWEQSVPRSFTFAIKASRYITHLKRLQSSREPVSHFMQALHMRKKKGPIVFQLPPHFPKDLQRLNRFLKVLPAQQRYAIEFRDPSWHTDDIYELLREYQVAFCLFEKGVLRSPRVITANFLYVRLHGRKEGYKGNYNAAALKEWHRWLKAQEKDVYIFFDNTAEKMYVLENALAFRKLTRR